MNDVGTLITYRYVRLAMVGLVVGIGVAVVERRLDVHGFQGSISSYYYSPARGMFVAALFAIGVCLICIRGGTVREDALLNVAGMLGFVVALVPTPPGGNDATLVKERTDAIRNNFPALLWIGAFAVVVLIVVYAATHGDDHATTTPSRAGWISAVVAVVLLVAAYVWYRAWHDSFLSYAHITAAVSMFAMIGLVAISDGVQTAGEPATRLRGWLYIGIAAAMGVAGIGIFVANHFHPWDQAMLDAEALLITLFAVFWAAQTIDLWNYADRKQAIAARRAPGG